MEDATGTRPTHLGAGHAQPRDSAMTDELQHLRMFYVWPFVVGAVGFFASRLFLAWINGADGLIRRDIVLAACIGVASGVMALRISQTWADDETHWLFFTLGLAFLAVVLVGSALTLAFYDIDVSDHRERGRW